MSNPPITPDNPLGIDRVAAQAEHERGKALMAKERAAIVGWLRRLAGHGCEIADLIEDGEHWKNQP